LGNLPTQLLNYQITQLRLSCASEKFNGSRPKTQKKTRGWPRLSQRVRFYSCFFSGRTNLRRKRGAGVHKKEEAKKSLLVHDGRMIALGDRCVKADLGWGTEQLP
jgi:hypothetical protein